MSTSLRSSAAPTLLRSLRAPRMLPSPPKLSRSIASPSTSAAASSSLPLRFLPLALLIPIAAYAFYPSKLVRLDSAQQPGGGSGGSEKVISLEELKTHNSIKDGLWVAIRGDIWDLTEYHHHHPGGPQVILKNSGKDVTGFFNHAHPRISNLHEMLDPSKLMGRLEGYVEPAKKEKKERAVEKMKVERREKPTMSS